MNREVMAEQLRDWAKMLDATTPTRAEIVGIVKGMEQVAADLELRDRPWPWCFACRSYHHPDNPTCRLLTKENSRG